MPLRDTVYLPLIKCVELIARDDDGKIQCRSLSIDSMDFDIRTGKLVNDSDYLECEAIENYGLIRVYILPNPNIKKSDGAIDKQYSEFELIACCVVVGTATFVVTRCWVLNRVCKKQGFRIEK